MRVKAERTFLSAGALLNDEFSMIAGSLIHAGSLIATYARETKFRLRREDYALPRQHFGRIAFLGWNRLLRSTALVYLFFEMLIIFFSCGR